jgi:hypothetical protein
MRRSLRPGASVAWTGGAVAKTDARVIIARAVAAAKETLAATAIEADLVRSTRLIADALGACDGIEVVDHALVSEAAFTLADLHYFRRWDWDYRSHSGEPGGEIAPSP